MTPGPEDLPLTLADGTTRAELTVGVDPELGANELRLCRSAASRLAGIERFTETAEIRRVPYFLQARCPDNPLLSEELRASLDERGIVRVGATVRDGDVLVSVVREDPDPPRTRPSIKADEIRICDESWRVRLGDPARIEAVRLIADEVDGLAGEILEVDLAIDRPLEPGDGLLCDGKVFGAVSEIAETTSAGGIVVDVAVGRAVAARLGFEDSGPSVGPRSIRRALESAAWRLRPRSTGPRSLITGQPLKDGRGAAVHVDQFAWLAERGMAATVAELAVRKSDEARVAGELRDLVERAEALPPMRAPKSLAYLRDMLRGLGFTVRLEDGDGHVRVHLAPTTSEQIRAGAAGEVRKPETVSFRTLDPIQGGLFCHDIFGRDSHSFRRWGFLSLAKPVIPWHWRRCSGVLSEALGLSPDDIEAVLAAEAALLVEGSTPRLVEVGEGVCGAEALREALRGRPLPEGRTIDRLFLDAIPVIPPGYRPLVLLANGNLATSDLNDLYRRMINRNNRLQKLIQLAAPEVIIRNEAKLLQLQVDQLFINSLTERPVAGVGGRPLWDLLHLAAASAATESKGVDWSATGRVVSRPGLDPCEVGVPTRALRDLSLSAGDPVLLMAHDSRMGVGRAALVVEAEGSAFQLAPEGLEALGLSVAVLPELDLHRPLGDEARRELRALLDGRLPPLSRCRADDPLRGDDPARFLAGVVEAAQSGEPIRLDGPRGWLLGGTGSTDFGEESPREPKSVVLKREDLLRSIRSGGA